MHLTILVTGATGTVGREVVKQLSLQDDVRVRAGVHSLIKGENLKRLPGVELVEIEYGNPDSLQAAFTHVDKLFLLPPFAEEQVAWSKTLVDQAKESGVKHIVKLSVIGADAEPGILLGRRHREEELYIEESGIAYTFLRPSSFMQNYTKYCAEAIKQQGHFYEPTGNGRVGLIDAHDIAAVAVEALTGAGHEGKAYNLTGPEALSNKEVATILSEATGRDITFVDAPEEATREAMLQQQMPEWMVDAMMEIYALQKAGQIDTVTNTVEQLTNCKPRTFRQFAINCRDEFL